MNTTVRALLLALLVCAAASANPATNKDILEVVADLEAGKNVNAKIAALVKKHNLADVMDAFKPRAKGGIGTGPPRPGDGIEFKIINLGKRALSKAALKKEAAELGKIAALNVALARISAAYAPAKPNRAGKGAKEWEQYVKEMDKAAKELTDAVKKGDPVGVRKAATGLERSCNKCHDDFR